MLLHSILIIRRACLCVEGTCSTSGLVFFAARDLCLTTRLPGEKKRRAFLDFTVVDKISSAIVAALPLPLHHSLRERSPSPSLRDEEDLGFWSGVVGVALPNSSLCRRRGEGTAEGGGGAATSRFGPSVSRFAAATSHGLSATGRIGFGECWGAADF